MYMVSLTPQRELAFFKVEKPPFQKEDGFCKQVFQFLFCCNLDNPAIQLLRSE